MGEGVSGTGGDSLCVIGQRQLPRLPAVMGLRGKQLQERRLEGGGEGGGEREEGRVRRGRGRRGEGGGGEGGGERERGGGGGRR